MSVAYGQEKHTVVYLLVLSSIVLALAFMISPNDNDSVIAQPSSTMTPIGYKIHILVYKIKIGQAQYRYLVPY
jgi:hypothetical protein